MFNGAFSCPQRGFLSIKNYFFSFFFACLMFRKYEFPRNKKIDCSSTKIKNNRITKNTKKKQKP